MNDWKDNSSYQHYWDVVARFAIVSLEYQGKTYSDIIPVSKLPFPIVEIRKALIGLILIEAKRKNDNFNENANKFCYFYMELANVVEDDVYKEVAKIYGEIDYTATEKADLERFAYKLSNRFKAFSEKCLNREIPEDDAKFIIVVDKNLKEKKNKLLDELIKLRKSIGLEPTDFFNELIDHNYIKFDENK